MPRVNRDLQRRMAARRERERRRPPTERRYPVQTDEPVDEAADAELLDGSPEVAAAPTATATARPSGAAKTTAARAPARPFSDYRAEYAYVGADLRRVAIVIGSLLVVLIVLHFFIAR
jgi:hypothetical protein